MLPYRISGRLCEVRGPFVTATLGPVSVGQQVRIWQESAVCATGEVLGFSEHRAVIGILKQLTPLSHTATVEVLPLRPPQRRSAVPLGSVLNSAGESLLPTHPQPLLETFHPQLVPREESQGCQSPLQQRAISTQLCTGVSALDLFTPIGHGQRLLVLARPGVGKTTLMGMIARGACHPGLHPPTASAKPPWGVDLNVIALIGERGREVGDFLRENAQILDRCIVVASTSEESALSRVRCAELAFEVAEYYRDCGCHVLLQLDSLTRLLRAQREVGLAAGELPVRQGYPPSVFAALPQITERAGRWEHGSITALFTLLVSGDEEDPLEDPMVEEMRGLTDGHLILSHKLALAGQYPAVDVVSSLSRLASRLQAREVSTVVEAIRHLLYRVRIEHELLLLSGRSDKEVQRGRETERLMRELLSQRTEEFRPVEDSLKGVFAIHDTLTRS